MSRRGRCSDCGGESALRATTAMMCNSSSLTTVQNSHRHRGTQARRRRRAASWSLAFVPRLCSLLHTLPFSKLRAERAASRCGCGQTGFIKPSTRRDDRRRGDVWRRPTEDEDEYDREPDTANSTPGSTPPRCTPARAPAQRTRIHRRSLRHSIHE